jgi:hypothetical protein
LKKAEGILLAIIIVFLPFMIVHPLGMAMPTTIVAVDPTQTHVTVGQTFSININITDVSGLVGFDFILSYDKSILNLTDIELGPFLKTAGGSTFLINLTTAGQIWLAACLYQPGGWTGISANGSGVLATATFVAAAPGSSSLDLSSKNSCTNEIELAADPQNPEIVAIPNTAINGYVTVSPDPSADIITQASITKTVVGQGYNLSINIAITNRGDLPETLNVASYANQTEIGEQTLYLANGNSTTVNLVWNTTGYAYGNYTISAYTSPVSGETNTANNGPPAGWVIVSLPGDITGPNGHPDGKVDMRDVGYIARRVGATPSSPLWDPNADINGDGIIDMKDVGIAARNLGSHYP